jgi:hypothetical protein
LGVAIDDPGHRARTLNSMATAFKPVGPKPARVYWMRRLLLLVPLVLVVAFLVYVFAFNSADPTPSGESPSPSPTVAPSPCKSANLDLSMVAFKSVKASAEKVTFSVSATNTSTSLCVVEVKPANTTVTIVSGKDRIWSTDDCGDWITPGSQSVAPGAKYDFTVDWQVRRSSADCKVAKDKLKPGYYQVQVDLGGAVIKKTFQIVK